MDIDITDLRIAVTLLCFATFLGIAYWAFAGRNRERFDEAARIPFDQE
jgi:cytochrome c oxidase cbb3-type subunit 4